MTLKQLIEQLQEVEKRTHHSTPVNIVVGGQRIELTTIHVSKMISYDTQRSIEVPTEIDTVLLTG